jgi:hypothetical protein
MKNPFEKESHSALIAGMVIGSAAAATAAYLLLTENGGAVRRRIIERLLALRNSLMAVPAEEVPNEHANDYMHPKMKAPKTDREELLHHEIIHE